jgi:hypothetical protein
VNIVFPGTETVFLPLPGVRDSLSYPKREKRSRLPPDGVERSKKGRKTEGQEIRGMQQHMGTLHPGAFLVGIGHFSSNQIRFDGNMPQIIQGGLIR